MFPRPPLVFLALALLAPMVVGDAAPYAPAEVVAFVASSSAVVAWTPGEVPADSYRVYGANLGANPVLLADTAEEETLGTLAVVPGGFAQYAVSGVYAGTESPLIFALAGPCLVRIHTFPEPGVTICKLDSAVKVRQP